MMGVVPDWNLGMVNSVLTSYQIRYKLEGDQHTPVLEGIP